MPANGYAWTGIAAALLLLGFIRASDATTEAGRAGQVLGAALGALAIAYLIWLFAQRVIRKRRAGFPPAVGLIAIGICALGTIPVLGDRAERSVLAAKPMTCVPDEQLYGKAVPGFEYVRLTGAERADALKELSFDDPAFGKPQVAVAQGRKEDDTVVLVAIKRANAADGLDAFMAGAESEKRNPRREPLAGHDTVWIDNPDGSKLVTSLKGCHFMIVIALDDGLIRRVAPSVFSLG